MPFAAAKFDLVVSYLSLIDIADSYAALDEMVRILRPGRYLLIGNLNCCVTAAQKKERGFVRTEQGHRNMTITNYLTEHCSWAEWRGVRIKNWHRPLSQDIQEALQAELRLVDFKHPLQMRAGRAVKVITTCRTCGYSFGRNLWNDSVEDAPPAWGTR